MYRVRHKYMRYTKEEELFLMENYPHQGSDYCANLLNRNRTSVCNKAFSLGLKLTNEANKRIKKKSKQKPFEQFMVNPSQFFNIETAEIAYILGILWADGSIYKNRVSLTCVKKDILELLPIFLSTGTWRTYSTNIPEYQEQMTIHTNNEFIADYLRDNFYTSKSTNSACAILNKIPKNLTNYWFRGLVDGDGCFYYNRRTGHQAQFSVSSSIHQDWTYLTSFLDGMHLKYSLFKTEGKRGNSSTLRMCGKSNISILGNYIYSGYEIDQIGLQRKYKIFKEIQSSRVRSVEDIPVSKLAESSLRHYSYQEK